MMTGSEHLLMAVMHAALLLLLCSGLIKLRRFRQDSSDTLEETRKLMATVAQRYGDPVPSTWSQESERAHQLANRVMHLEAENEELRRLLTPTEG
jgi:hypothetical protein